MYILISIALFLIGLIFVGLSYRDTGCYYSEIESIFFGIGLIFILLSLFVPTIIYITHDSPLIDEQAHNYCISQGYDTFETWGGVGIFPTEYNYVKCKFVDNRQDLQGHIKLE